jgi:DHA1 family tetracycline resistance protein-like MFS transporter
VTTALTPTQIRRRFLLLHGLRWLPTGLLIPVLVLLPLERGLSLAQYGAAAAVQGLVVLALELPTGGLSDALGRRPVLLVACVVNLASLAVLAVADTFVLFMVVYLFQGVYRALDSGPLEAWYVDSALAADPDADYEVGLTRSGVVIGVAIAVGALASGGLVALGPLRFGSWGRVSALTVPVLVAIVLTVVSLIAVAALLHEVRPGRGLAAMRSSLRAVPGAVGGALMLLRRSRVVLALVAVEVFWGFGMATFESLMPVRLAEVVGDPESAAALLGPTGSAAWLASAAGAALVPVLVRRVGAPWTGAVLRIAQGVTVVGMGLFAGPVGLIAAYLLCYTVHGAANPVHSGLLHRQVDGPYRGSLISLNSMVSQPAGALGLVVLTGIAQTRSVSTALIIGAVVMAVAAPLYLVARRPAIVVASPAAPEPVL